MANEDKSTRYQRLRRRAAIATGVLDAVLLAGVAVSGQSRALADGAAAATSMTSAATVGFVLALVAVRTVLVLPLAYASEVVHERRYGRALVALAQWCGAYLWRAIVLAAVLAGAALVIQAAAWWSPANWWAWASGVLAAVLISGAALVPALVVRSASEVSPIQRPGLAARLTELALRAGAGGVPVFEWKVGRRATAVTAVLAGIGPSRRILVADTVLDTHTDDEVEVIVAHELAHYRRGDSWWSAAMAAGAAAAGLYASARLLPTVAGALAISGPSDTAALPLVALVCGGVALVLSPVLNAVSRAQERRADRDALAWTRNASALVRTLKRLSAAHLAEDRPPLLAHALFHRHPAAAERIAEAEKWANAVPQTEGPGPVAWSLEPGTANPSRGAQAAGPGPSVCGTAFAHFSASAIRSAAAG